MATHKPKILFIGYGHLAKSLLSPIFLKNHLLHYVNSNNLIYSLKRKITYKIKNYDYVFLLVRPDIFKKNGSLFKKYISPLSVIVSCMAGISINSISHKLDNKNIIRIMPNLMAKNTLSQTYIYAKRKKILNKNFDKIIQSFGSNIYTSCEDDINIATAVYGSGPAFIAYLINSYLMAVKSLSSKSKFKDIDIINLFKNVLHLNLGSKDLEYFINSIASKKGTTQAGVKFLKSQNIKKIMYTTLDRAYKRAKDIGFEK